MAKLEPAPVVDQNLADLFKDERDPQEKVALDQRAAQSVWTSGVAFGVAVQGRLVQLECSHFVVTKSVHKASCPRCGEMIRSGYDYDGFRNLRRTGVDAFSWPGDPLRILHEPSESEMDRRFDPSGA